MCKQLVKLAVIPVIAVIAQHFANIAAYAERGYYAMGGETFIFPLVLAVGGFITGLFDWRLELYTDEDNEMEDNFYDTDDD